MRQGIRSFGGPAVLAGLLVLVLSPCIDGFFTPCTGGSGFRLLSDAISAAGGTSVGGDVILGMTAGQTVTGRAASMGMAEEAGFWRSGVLPVTGIPPLESTFHLYPFAPNPFSRETTIRYSIPSSQESARVRVRIFDVSGRLVQVLEDGIRPTGVFELTWDGRSSTGKRVGAGVYFCLMEIGHFRDVQRVIRAR